MRWGRDNEEREAVVKKAHDAYAMARQAMEKAAAAQAQMAELREEIEALRRLVVPVQPKRRIAA